MKLMAVQTRIHNQTAAATLSFADEDLGSLRRISKRSFATTCPKDIRHKLSGTRKRASPSDRFRQAHPQNRLYKATNLRWITSLCTTFAGASMLSIRARGFGYVPPAASSSADVSVAYLFLSIQCD